MLEIINELNQLRNYSQDNLIVSKLGNIINKINYIINENKKNHESIMNQFTKLQNQISQLSQKLNVNNINNQQELKVKIGDILVKL